MERSTHQLTDYQAKLLRLINDKMEIEDLDLHLTHWIDHYQRIIHEAVIREAVIIPND